MITPYRPLHAMKERTHSDHTPQRPAGRWLGVGTKQGWETKAGPGGADWEERGQQGEGL